MSESDVPRIAALFVVVFDQKVGYVQYFKRIQNTIDECKLHDLMETNPP
jgi:hypothetical protein